MTYASRADRARVAVEAAPVSAMEIVTARALMRRGLGLKEAATRIGVTPSSKLDLALWNHLGTPDEDLIASKPRRPKRYMPEF